MMACPAGTNAGRYVSLIAEGHFEEAYRVARDPNPMASVCGRVCAHPCETACRRGAIDQPISIRALKRFLTERYGPESRTSSRPQTAARSTNCGYKVAIVGSGPVGLSAAYDLALLGYSVTIFEAAPVAGGMLHLGIPEYRLPRSVVEAQIREILDAGDVTLKLNSAAGRDFTISGLREQGFDAVVLAVGAHRSRDLSIPGVDLDGVHKGIDFLLNANLGYRFSIGKKVVVIGGGNVAMDVARSAAREVLKQHPSGVEGATPSEDNVAAVATHEMVDVSLSALRMGAREVNIVCLERRERDAGRVRGDRRGGGRRHPHARRPRSEARDRPRRQSGRAWRRFGPNRSSMRRANSIPSFEEGSESIIECDTVILAIGQAPRLDFLTPEDGVEISPRGLIMTDRQTLMTSAPGVFAGGDCVFGPRLIIDSVGDGKRIAIGIDQYLTGRTPPEPEIEVEILRPPQNVPRLHGNRPAADSDASSRPAHRRHRGRTGLSTRRAPCAKPGAACAAGSTPCSRAMKPTDRNAFSAADASTYVRKSVSSWCRSTGSSSRPRCWTRFAATAEFSAWNWTTCRPNELGIITGSAMLKDETRCIRCGLCAERCPVSVITMEAYSMNLAAHDPAFAIGD